MSRSHHYNHSTYNDLILSGLLGIRPHTDDVLELNPLLPEVGSAERPIRYFALQDLRYYGREISLIYDAAGTRYHAGAGFSVFASGKRIYGPAPLRHISLSLAGVPKRADSAAPGLPVDLAERAPSSAEMDLPIASASSSTAPGSSTCQAIDGRLWFFSEIVNGWSPVVDATTDLQTNRLELAFFSEGDQWQAPSSVTVQSIRTAHRTKFLNSAWRSGHPSQTVSPTSASLNHRAAVPPDTPQSCSSPDPPN